MRHSFCQFVNSILLASVPMEISASTPGCTFYTFNLQSVFSDEELEKIDVNSDYDLILALIDKIESGALEDNCSPETLNAINWLLANFARKGSLSDDPDDAEVLEEDIEELMHEASFTQSNDYLIFPAVFYGRDKNVIICRSWLKKQCHQIGKFVRHHKKEILIGAAIVVAVTAVAVVATTIACTAASAAAGAVASSDFNEKSEPKERPASALSLPAVVVEQTTSFKELIIEENLLQAREDRSLGEKTRELGAYLAHEIFDGAADLALIVPEEVKVACHEKIDQIFSTKLGVRWSKELKANSLMDNFDVGIIPVPGLLTGQKEIIKLGVNEVNSIKGWNVGDPIQNLTALGSIPSWSTVRRRFWKNKAHYHPEEHTASELERMQKGLAPQRHNPRTDQLESKELHHIPPQREGNLFKVVELWPDEHAATDVCRKIGK